MSTDDNCKLMKPDELIRINEEPVSLKNLGNSKIIKYLDLIKLSACYFNSLLQTLFQIKNFHEEIMKFKKLNNIEKVLDSLELPPDSTIRNRKLVCKKIIIFLFINRKAMI